MGCARHPDRPRLLLSELGGGEGGRLLSRPRRSDELLLDLEAWSAIVANNPALSEIEPDTEALLANRMNGARRYYRAPIDHCYELVGLMRMHWRGVSGGDEAWRAIDGFFGELAERHGRGV